jgi:hypothetical protein
MSTTTSIPQEPRFGISSLDEKAIREWSLKLYEKVVEAKEGNAETLQTIPYETDKDIGHLQEKQAEEPLQVLKMRLARARSASRNMTSYDKLWDSSISAIHLVSYEND